MHATTTFREKATILDAGVLDRTLTRLAHQILEHQPNIADVVFIGIRNRGDVLAKRLAAKIQAIEHVLVPAGALDISRHRDDLSSSSHSSLIAPHSSLNEIPCDIADRVVILVDDVLFTGRSVRAALDALVEFGRPAKIQLAVLIDRGHREYPIRADYVGKNLPTSLKEDVQVRLQESDGQDCVVIRESI